LRAVEPVEGSHVGDRAQSDQIEQGKQVRLSAIGAKKPRWRRVAHNRNCQQEGDADRCEMAVGGRLWHRSSSRLGLTSASAGEVRAAALVMIDHDHIDTGGSRAISSASYAIAPQSTVTIRLEPCSAQPDQRLA
jgi:hypothetical protein